jgi:hypothetical protein
MIFLDKKGHLISSHSVEELHCFAKTIGLKREWFQDHPRHPHYDLTTTRMIIKAIQYGAHMATSREIVKMLRSNIDEILWQFVGKAQACQSEINENLQTSAQDKINDKNKNKERTQKPIKNKI